MELYIVLFKQRKLLFKQHNTTKQSLSLSLSLSLSQKYTALSLTLKCLSPHSIQPSIKVITDRSNHRWNYFILF